MAKKKTKVKAKRESLTLESLAETTPKPASFAMFTSGQKVRSKASKSVQKKVAADSFFHNDSGRQFAMSKTWSVAALGISSHSAGYMHVEDSDDDSDSVGDSDKESNDDSSSDGSGPEDHLGSMLKTPFLRTKNPARGSKPCLTRETAILKAKNKISGGDKIACEFPSIIQECDDEDDSNSDDSSDAPLAPTSMKNFANSSKLDDDVELDTGYSSDGALVRKRMEMIQQQQEDSRRKLGVNESEDNEKKKKKGGKKKKVTTKKKTKKKGKRPGPASDKDDSQKTFAESTDVDSNIESDDETEKSTTTKKKKSKAGNVKKKKTKGDTGKKKKVKKKKKKRVISFIVDGDDDACENFDKRLQEIEEFESAMLEERKLMVKERQEMSYERETMEMRLDEQFRHCEELTFKIKELEQNLQSTSLENEGNNAESVDERLQMETRFEFEKAKLEKQLKFKDREIEELKEAAITQQENIDAGTPTYENDATDGKSRERLQGELLQTVAKLSEKEAKLRVQTIELDAIREELVSLKDKSGINELKKKYANLQDEKKKLEEDLDQERKENGDKLKDKDETVSFLMNELAALKQEQSLSCHLNRAVPL